MTVWLNISQPLSASMNPRRKETWNRLVILAHIGDNLICSNQRGITLLSIPGKLIALILSQPSIHAVRSKRQVQQVNVVPGHSIFSATRLPKKVSAFRHMAFVTFIDFKAAFSSVDSNNHWLLCQNMYLPAKLCQLYTLVLSTLWAMSV